MTLTTTTLGGVSLSPSLVLTGIEAANSWIYPQRRTLSGASVVQAAPVVGGRTLTLVSEYHLTLAEVTAIKAVAALGQPVTLIHHRGTFTVYIVGVAVDPAIDHSDPDGTEWQSGSITLLEA